MRLGLVAARVAALAAVLISSTTCQIADLLKPSGLERIEVAYASDSVLVVAAPTRPSIAVKVNGAQYTLAQLLLVSSDSGVLAVHGDTLVPKQRGTVTLAVSLQGSTLPRNAPGLTQKLSVVADTVTVDSASVRLASLGDTVTLAATARDARGGAIAGATARWSSSDTNIVTVTPAGRLAAKANGTVTVRAMVDRDTAPVPVTVAQVLTKWSFEPASLRVDALTATGSVAATGHDARGNAIASLSPATWSIGDATIASVSAAGDVTALKNGATWLFAARGAVRDSIPVTVAQRATLVTVTPKPPAPVTSLGAQVQLTARAFDRKAVEMQGAPLSWLTLEPGLARVGSDGLVTALAIGTAHVVATLDQGADTVVVVISNDPAVITIAPDSALATSVGDTLVFRAVARNGRGDSVGATFTWRTPDTAVVNVLADGRAIARAVGVARVIATVGSKADTCLAKVTNVPTAIDITPATRAYTSLGDVDTVPLTVTNARGAALPRGAVSWTSDDPLIARVTSGGIVTARDTGETVVRATSGAVTDSVVVTVQNLPASIVIGSPPVDTLTALGQMLALPVEVRNARGALIAGFPVAWRSTNRVAVDTVRPTGEALAVGWGTTRLIATAGGAADTVDLAVQNPTRFYVNNAFFPAPRVGTMARPYARIQNAVDAAEAGDTVIVLKGLGRYSESLNLVRKIVLLGDSSVFVGRGRNSADLPLISHDTGAYAIRAHTTAPVTIKYLAISHTLDGPALDADGSDVSIEYVTVNRTGTATAPIGRGISIANSNAGSYVGQSRIYNVSAYGIRLYRVNGGSVIGDSVDMVVATPDGYDGSGIVAVGGPLSVWGSWLQRTNGPMIRVDSSSNFAMGATVFRGPGNMVRLTDGTGLAFITQRNSFVLEWVPWAGGDGYGAHWKPAIQIIRSGDLNKIEDNTFSGTLEFCYPVFCPVVTVPWIYSQDRVNSLLEVGRNTFHGGGVVLTSQNERISAYNNRADSVQAYYVAAGSDLLISEGDTVNATTDPCVLATDERGFLPTAGAYNLRHAVLNGCALWHGPGAIAVDVNGTNLNILGARVTGMPRTMTALTMRLGGNLTVDSSFFAGGADTTSPRNDWCSGSDCAGVRVEAYSATIQHSVFTGFHGFAGLSVGNTQWVALGGNAVHGNRFGFATGEGVAVTTPSSPAVNDVFDNDSAGFEYQGSSALTLPNVFWWGDGRGPRGNPDFTATGDTILSTLGASVTASAAAAPGHVGTQPAALRAVRGDLQTAGSGGTLPKALTVRVVDADGLPVPGISVQFSVTAGGGNFGGAGNVTVTTNASGLAEGVLTLGPAPGANTVKVSTGGGVPDLILTATGT